MIRMQLCLLPIDGVSRVHRMLCDCCDLDVPTGRGIPMFSDPMLEVTTSLSHIGRMAI